MTVIRLILSSSLGTSPAAMAPQSRSLLSRWIHALATRLCVRYVLHKSSFIAQSNDSQVGSATPRAGDVRCKWEARVAASTPFTREYVIKANNPVIETKDGILAGQYVTPVTEWIQPEINVPGAESVPYDFGDIRGLVQGDFLDGERFGPLDPFPGPSPAPPSKTCSPSTPTDGTTPSSVPAPTAFVAPFAAAQRGGATVLLVAQNNNTDLSNSQLNFAWSQVKPSVPSASVSHRHPDTLAQQEANANI